MTYTTQAVIITNNYRLFRYCVRTPTYRTIRRHLSDPDVTEEWQEPAADGRIDYLGDYGTYDGAMTELGADLVAAYRGDRRCTIACDAESEKCSSNHSIYDNHIARTYSIRYCIVTPAIREHVSYRFCMVPEIRCYHPVFTVGIPGTKDLQRVLSVKEDQDIVSVGAGVSQDLSFGMRSTGHADSVIGEILPVHAVEQVIID
jgi:hypothetical protein